MYVSIFDQTTGLILRHIIFVEFCLNSHVWLICCSLNWYGIFVTLDDLLALWDVFGFSQFLWICWLFPVISVELDTRQEYDMVRPSGYVHILKSLCLSLNRITLRLTFVMRCRNSLRSWLKPSINFVVTWNCYLRTYVSVKTLLWLGTL